MAIATLPSVEKGRAAVRVIIILHAWPSHSSHTLQFGRVLYQCDPSSVVFLSFFGFFREDPQRVHAPQQNITRLRCSCALPTTRVRSALVSRPRAGYDSRVIYPWPGPWLWGVCCTIPSFFIARSVANNPMAAFFAKQQSTEA